MPNGNGRHTPPSYWAEHDPYPRPRPRTVAELIAAGLLSEEEAVRQLQLVQWRPRVHVFFAAISAAGYARIVTPVYAGKGVIKQLVLIPRFDIGNPTDLKVYWSSDPGGQEAVNAAAPVANPADVLIWTGSVVSTTANIPRAQSLPMTGGTTYQGAVPLKFNYVVEANEFVVKCEFEQNQAGTIEFGGELLVYEGVPDEQLAMALAA